MPDIIFIFKCNKNVLLKRLFFDKLSEEDLIYKRHIISMFTDRFNKCIEGDMPDELKTRMVVIDGNASPIDIHQEIIQHLNPYINACI